MYIPHFVSIVIVAALTYQLFSTTDGVAYHMLVQVFGKQNAPDIMSDPKLFSTMIVGQNLWKETGYGTIIYLAALSSVDTQLYEAAKIDGAGRWQLMWHVTLPAIRGTIILMLIMKVGSLLNTGYEQIFLMQNAMNRSVSDVFDTYIYTKGIVNGQYSLATAAGLFKSIVSMVMVVGAVNPACTKRKEVLSCLASSIRNRTPTPSVRRVPWKSARRAIRRCRCCSMF